MNNIFNQPQVTFLRYITLTGIYSFDNGVYRLDNDFDNISYHLFDLVETQNYIGAITYGIRSPEIISFTLNIETMLLTDSTQYPYKEILETQITRALGNLSLKDLEDLEITTNNTYITVQFSRTCSA